MRRRQIATVVLVLALTVAGFPAAAWVEQVLASHPTLKPAPYTGIGFLDIPEFQDLGTNVGDQFSAAIAGQKPAAAALALAQLYAQAVGNTYRTA